MEPDRPQHVRPAACLIAQQHSSVTLVSMHFYPRAEKFGSGFKKQKVVSLYSRSFFKRMRKLKMRVSLCTATGDPGGGDRKLSYSRSTAANVESQMDLI